ncbi:MAG: hypothetical protein K2X95_09260 [Flavobacteriaceae bacterium]|nr:hypothetical protein [Flavobacteriaceae bacterium]
MARILSSLIGDLRGSIGGQTYSRNKAGAFIRQRVKPVNPQTVAQQTARYRFGNMSILYQSLNTTQKDCWEAFARTHYNPLKGNNTGIYSGGNAFVALRQSAGQGNQISNLQTMASDGDDLSITSVPYNSAVEPPLAPTSSTILDTLSVPHPFNVINIQINEDSSTSFQLEFPDVGPVAPSSFTAFKNAENQFFGIGLYMSNNLKFEGSKPNTAMKIQTADTGVVTLLAKTPPGNPSMGDTFEITTAATLDPANTRDFPCVGDIVLVTPFVRSIDGAQKLMTPQYVTITAP